MGFMSYLLMGSLVYVAGFTIHHKHLKAKKQQGVVYTIKSPIIWQCVLGCFVAMVLVSALLSLYILKHEHLDVAYVLVNSLVATVIFYFGLNPDETNMKLPD